MRSKGGPMGASETLDCGGHRVALSLPYFLIAIIIACSLASGAYGVSISRGPVIQNPDALPTTVTIEWWTDSAGDSTVLYGPTMALGSSVNVVQNNSCDVGNAGTCHIVRLTGLTPGMRYYYQIETNGTALLTNRDPAKLYFTTLKDPSDQSDFFFNVFGDWGGCPDSVFPEDCAGTGTEAHVGYLQDQADPPILMTIGDNACMSGEMTDWDTRAFPYYTQGASSSGWLMQRAQFFPALGNHDMGGLGLGGSFMSPWATRPYRLLFILPPNSPDPERYYSFDSGDVHFTVLDSNTETDSEDQTQTNWLQSDLALTTRKWKFAFLHHPSYSCNSDGSNAGTAEVRNTWGPLFEQYGVDIVFDGHIHKHERTHLMHDFTSSDAPERPTS